MALTKRKKRFNLKGMNSSGSGENIMRKMVHRHEFMKGLKPTEFGLHGGDNGGDGPKFTRKYNLTISDKSLIVQRYERA